MKAISIRQPWAYAILHLGKRVENRDWRGPPSYRGPLLIHAAAGCTREEYELAAHWMRSKGLASWPRWSDKGPPRLPPLAELDRGGFVARARLSYVINPIDARPSDVSNPWYAGALGLVLDDIEPLRFHPYKGALGLFDVPDNLDLRSKAS